MTTTPFSTAIIQAKTLATKVPGSHTLIITDDFQAVEEHLKHMWEKVADLGSEQGNDVEWRYSNDSRINVTRLRGEHSEFHFAGMEFQFIVLDKEINQNTRAYLLSRLRVSGPLVGAMLNVGIRAEMVDVESRSYDSEGRPLACYRCGRELQTYEGEINGKPFCHPDDTDLPDCYVLEGQRHAKRALHGMIDVSGALSKDEAEKLKEGFVNLGESMNGGIIVLPEGVFKQHQIAPLVATVPVPYIGQMVHYRSYGTPNGEYKPALRAAVVTQVRDAEGMPVDPNDLQPGEEGTGVDLCVLNPTGQHFNQFVAWDREIAGCWTFIGDSK